MRAFAVSVATFVTLSSFTLFGGAVTESEASIGWTTDLQTGAVWRSMSTDELAAVGWSGHKGWITKNFGSLDGFASSSNVVLNVAYKDQVKPLPFDAAGTVETLVGALSLVDLDSSILPLTQDLSSSWNETYREYESSNGWYATLATVSGHFAAATSTGGSYVWMWGNDTRLEVGEDFVYTVELECTAASSSPIHIGLGDAGDGCPASSFLRDVLEQGGSKQKTVAQMGEVAWCTAHHEWVADMQVKWKTITEAFKDTQRKPVVAWRSCTKMATNPSTGQPYTYNHDSDRYIHVHSDDDASVHPWAFNNVPATSHDNEVEDSQSYFLATIRLAGQNHNAYGSRTGMDAWAYHTTQTHDNFATPQYVQLIHKDEVEGAFGWGYQPGSLSITTDASSDGLTPAHELGHNMGADHCDSSQVDSKWTIMVSSSDADCPRSWNSRHPYFSSTNRDNINGS